MASEQNKQGRERSALRFSPNRGHLSQTGRGGGQPTTCPPSCQVSVSTEGGGWVRTNVFSTTEFSPAPPTEARSSWSTHTAGALNWRRASARLIACRSAGLSALERRWPQEAEDRRAI